MNILTTKVINALSEIIMLKSWLLSGLIICVKQHLSCPILQNLKWKNLYSHNFTPTFDNWCPIRITHGWNRVSVMIFWKQYFYMNCNIGWCSAVYYREVHCAIEYRTAMHSTRYFQSGCKGLKNPQASPKLVLWFLLTNWYIPFWIKL